MNSASVPARAAFAPPARLRVLLRGVGGQAIPLMVRLLAGRLARHARAVDTYETRGMAQRGGVVAGVIDARFGNGSSFHTVLLGLELCEGARGLPLLRRGDAAFMALSSIIPPGTWQAHRSKPSAPGAPEPIPRLDVDGIRGIADQRGVTLRLVNEEANGAWSVLRAAIDDGFLPR
jgi:hypothetical protein